MKLFVVRHGETIYNRMNKVCGVTESELTENGRDQARELAEEFAEQKDENDIRYIYVSPLKRAIDTAAYIEKVLGIKSIVEDRLHEFNFGTMEGIPCDDPSFVAMRRNPYSRFDGGESMFSVAQRIYNFLDEIKIKHRNENVLCVCHGTVGRVIDTYFHNVTIEYFVTYQIRNCEIRQYEL